MDNWQIVEVLVVLVGLFITVGNPVIKLIKSIDKLNLTCALLENKFSNFEEKNTDNHKRLWRHNDDQDRVLTEHETRLSDIEKDLRD